MRVVLLLTLVLLSGCTTATMTQRQPSATSVLPTSTAPPVVAAAAPLGAPWALEPSEGAQIDPGRATLLWRAPLDAPPGVVYYVALNGEPVANCFRVAETQCTVTLDAARRYEWSVTASFDTERVSASAAFNTKVNLLHVYLAHPPADAQYDADAVHAAAVEGMRRWDGYNNTKIVLSDQEDDGAAYGEFLRDWGGDRLGVAFGRSQTFQIGLGNSDCNGKWTPFDLTTIARIAQHEMGHILGMPHSADATNIMYPTMPLGYARPCEWTSGSKELPAGWYQQWNFTATKPYTIHVTLNAGAGNLLQFCTGVEGHEACRPSSQRTNETIVVREWERLVAYCENVSHPCQLEWTISYSEAPT